MANPAPIITTLQLDPSLQQTVRIDGICTVVDAKHISGHLDRKEETGKENEACAQVAYADRIILNKTDLIDAAQLRDLKDRVAAINGLASLQDAERSVVPVDYVLGIGGYALSEISTQVCPYAALALLMSTRKSMRKHVRTCFAASFVKCAVSFAYRHLR